MQVFIQSPESIFQLEGAREAKIPDIATFIQKIVRGVLARRYAKRLKAAYKIAIFYKKCKLRKYVQLLQGTFK
jgi:myosin heavy subunit